MTVSISNIAPHKRRLTDKGIFDINVKGIFHSLNAVLPHFLAQGHGSIVNISSCVTSKPTSGLLYYNATKGAVDLLTRGLAAEYSHRGIRVNGISPSLGNTALVSEFVGEEFSSEMAKVQATEAPVQRMVTPLDIAKGCLYLASPHFNDFQTYVPIMPKCDLHKIYCLHVTYSGIMLRVDGGQYVRLPCLCGLASVTSFLLLTGILVLIWTPERR